MARQKVILPPVAAPVIPKIEIPKIEIPEIIQPQVESVEIVEIHSNVKWPLYFRYEGNSIVLPPNGVLKNLVKSKLSSLPKGGYSFIKK